MGTRRLHKTCGDISTDTVYAARFPFQQGRVPGRRETIGPTVNNTTCGGMSGNIKYAARFPFQHRKNARPTGAKPKAIASTVCIKHAVRCPPI